MKNRDKNETFYIINDHIQKRNQMDTRFARLPNKENSQLQSIFIPFGGHAN